MADRPEDPLAAVERALGLDGWPRQNRAQRRRYRGTEPGAGKHPLGATKPLASEKAAARRKRRRSR